MITPDYENSEEQIREGTASGLDDAEDEITKKFQTVAAYSRLYETPEDLVRLKIISFSGWVGLPRKPQISLFTIWEG